MLRLNRAMQNDFGEFNSFIIVADVIIIIIKFELSTIFHFRFYKSISAHCSEKNPCDNVKLAINKNEPKS